MPPKPPPQPIRFAIQKARGKGWKTLEVGENLKQAEARFDLMVKVNPRAYFRLVQLDHNPEADFEGMEFNWTLIHLYDPTKGSAKGNAARPSKSAKAPKRRKEKVPLPVRFYVGVVVLGLLAGALVYLRWGLGTP
ncbi:hypothetical protein [Azospirillum sp. TSO22-1]|uniref:hypothetical protein n=1 Tax=Azospirillum sp. TSO22-1 TaxID=716789 RepID=UPI000D615905|nr:hypothetical protein [Azospirillum sp. TSO22-1]PWC31530.1 hypothetical protein TSO221_33915 [Azospirillum sp. TSO22-1]